MTRKKIKMKNLELTHLINNHINVIQQLSCIEEDFSTLCNAVLETILKGRKILTCGNGGSAAQASHLASELVWRFQRKRQHVPCIALSTDPAIITAVANDKSYEQIFAVQIKALGNPEDMLIAFSASGRSPNILMALEEAGKLQMKTALFTGHSFQPERTRCPRGLHIIRVPSEETALVQEAHLFLIHALCRYIDEHIEEST